MKSLLIMIWNHMPAWSRGSVLFPYTFAFKVGQKLFGILCVLMYYGPLVLGFCMFASALSALASLPQQPGKL